MGKDETLLQVKETEAKAKTIVEQAEERHRTIITSARREAAKRAQDAEIDLRSRSEAALASERGKIAVQREEIVVKGNEEAEKLGSRAKDSIPKAKTFLKEQFMRTIDASAGAND